MAAKWNYVKSAADRKWLQQEKQRFFGRFDAVAVHGPGSVYDEDKLCLFQFGPFDGAEIGEEIEGDDVLAQKPRGGSVFLGLPGRENGNGPIPTIVRDLDAQIVVEFVIDDFDRRHLFRTGRGWRESDLFDGSEQSVSRRWAKPHYGFCR